MVGTGVDLQLAQLGGPEAVARQHPLDRQADDLLGRRSSISSSVRLRKLKVYAGPDHPHAAQKPEPMEVDA